MNQPQAGGGSLLHFTGDRTEERLFTSGHEGWEAAGLLFPAHAARGK